MALEDEKVGIHKRGFPSAEVRGSFDAGLPYLSPSSRAGPGESRMRRICRGSPRPAGMKDRAFPPKLPFGTAVTRSESDSKEVMQWTT